MLFLIKKLQRLKQNVEPEAAVNQARRLLGEGQIQQARELIITALKTSPTHADLLGLQQAISPGQVKRKSDNYPNRKTERDWIARNREQYSGKWVALVGEHVLAMEDNPKTLLEKLKQKKISETPLVHHLI